MTAVERVKAWGFGLNQRTLVAILSVTILAVWLFSTPGGLLGKADAVGYAVCHRIDARSFHLGDRQLPLCARCTGIYLGVILGLAAMAAGGRSRAGMLPPRGVIAILVGFIALMGFDGINSYLTFFPSLPHLYEPRNWLRLTTGTLNGLALAALIYPTFNQTLWRRWEPVRAVQGIRELVGLMALAAILIALVLTENPLILYPLALLSAAGVLALLTLIYAIVVLMLLRRENSAESWRDVALPVVAGLTLAILQVGLIDLVRHALTGTWGGFPLL